MDDDRKRKSAHKIVVFKALRYFYVDAFRYKPYIFMKMKSAMKIKAELNYR